MSTAHIHTNGQTWIDRIGIWCWRIKNIYSLHGLWKQKHKISLLFYISFLEDFLLEKVSFAGFSSDSIACFTIYLLWNDTEKAKNMYNSLYTYTITIHISISHIHFYLKKRGLPCNHFHPLIDPVIISMELH